MNEQQRDKVAAISLLCCSALISISAIYFLGKPISTNDNTRQDILGAGIAKKIGCANLELLTSTTIIEVNNMRTVQIPNHIFPAFLDWISAQGLHIKCQVKEGPRKRNKRESSSVIGATALVQGSDS